MSKFGRIFNHVTRTGHSVHSTRNLTSTDKSFRHEIVPQLTYFNVRDYGKEGWTPSKDYADSKDFLYKVTPGRLIRQCDLERGHKYMQTIAGITPLKEGISLVAYHLSRDINIGHLFTEDNVLISENGNIRLLETDLPGQTEAEGPENIHVAFSKLHDWYFGGCGLTGLLGRSANFSLSDDLLPPELVHLRGLLKNSATVDKRLISNHAAQLYRHERTQQIWGFCHFLRNEAVFVPPGDYRKKLARDIYIELGKLVRGGLKGEHPMFDHWMDHAAFLGKQIILSQGGASTQQVIQDQDLLNGKLLVAVMRYCIEHPDGPGIARRQKKRTKSYTDESELDHIVPFPGYYSFGEVVELRDFKLPMFAPAALNAFLKCNLEEDIPVAAKLRHLLWSDIRS